jgi:hypothetical protein
VLTDAPGGVSVTLTYDQVRQHVEDAGFFTFIREHCDKRRSDVEPDLVCASRQMPHGQGLTGCSFYVKERAGSWYVVTWGPRAYRVDPSLVVELCLAFLRYTDRTLGDVPQELKLTYKLTEAPEAM